MTEFIASTYTAPDWLNKQFLENALKNSLDDHSNVKILQYTIEPATNVGDNFISQMFRVTASISTINDESETISLIIKSLPRGENVEKWVREYSFFEREMKMFSETLPEMQEILDEVEGFSRLFAKVYFQQGPPNDLIILEDLRKEGFSTANRQTGLDIPHCKAAVEALAVYHAASLVKRNPKIKERHNYIYWHRTNEDMFKRFLNIGFSSLSKLVKDWPEFPDGFSEIISQKRDSIISKMFDGCDRNDNDDLNVILHGDAWTGNFMFKYENRKPVDVKLVDFQASCFNHATVDLLYFLFSSPSNQLKIKQNDVLLQCYYDKLIEVSKILKNEINLKFVDFRGEFMRRLGFGFMAALTVFPFTTAPSSEAAELDAFLGESSDMPEKSQYDTATFKEGIRMMLPYFIQHGFFD